jgi:hypothetical protein
VTAGRAIRPVRHADPVAVAAVDVGVHGYLSC